MGFGEKETRQTLEKVRQQAGVETGMDVLLRAALLELTG